MHRPCTSVSRRTFSKRNQDFCDSASNGLTARPGRCRCSPLAEIPTSIPTYESVLDTPVSRPPPLPRLRFVEPQSCTHTPLQVLYNDRGDKGKVRTALDIPTKGDKAWKTAAFCIGDGAMDHSHKRGSDFEISSKNKTDVVSNQHHLDQHHVHT